MGKHLAACLVMLSLLAASTPPAAAIPEPSDPWEMDAYLKSVIPAGMEKYHIPGAVFIFVKDGRVFYSKGYGYANIEKKIPVDPDRTVFRVASNSKMFVATAVMQLVERGKLRLDADVNTYLGDIRLPSTWPAPVTLFNLLTHTPGFDEKNLNTGTLMKENQLPLDRYIRENVPDRVMPPGSVTSYSNYGFAMAGYVVELASRRPFHQYVKENILLPLGMKSSDFLPRADLVDRLATPYLYRDGVYEVFPPDYWHDYPAASLMTTAADMARFMIAHLQGGRYGAARILQRESAEAMHRRQFTNHPGLPGMGLCFIESEYKGQRMLEHGGWVAGFKTLTALIPAHDAGFFLSYNIEYAGPGSLHYALAKEVQKGIIDHYYAAGWRAPKAAAVVPEEAARLEGSYRTNRVARRELTKFGVFMSDTVVRTAKDGGITVGDDRYVPMGRLLYMKEDGSDRVAFRENAQGQITHLFKGPSPIVAWDRLQWHETSAFHSTLLGFCAVVFLAAFVTAVLVHFYRRKKGIKAERAVRWSWRIMALIGFLNLATLVIMVLLLLNSAHISFGWSLPTGLRELLAVPIITAVLSIALIILTALLWLKKKGGTFDRIAATLVCVAAVVFIYFMQYWNLLGFKTG